MKFSENFNRNIKPFFLYEDESVNKQLFSDASDSAVKRQPSVLDRGGDTDAPSNKK